MTKTKSEAFWEYSFITEEKCNPTTLVGDPNDWRKLLILLDEYAMVRKKVRKASNGSKQLKQHVTRAASVWYQIIDIRLKLSVK